mgnify:CR=1 FL=1|tara:strand:- start:384 stop:839 length:456 start_codon:yes stop_codon:yes gene_type:complete
MNTRILKDGVWVDGTPANGEWYQLEVASGVWQESRYNEPVPEQLLIDIVVTSIDGALQTSEDFATTIVTQGNQFTVNGTLAIPNRIFTLPIKNTSTGELLFFTASVVNGEFSVTITLNKNSQYQYTNTECNLDLEPAMFTVAPMKFNVVAA